MYLRGEHLYLVPHHPDTTITAPGLAALWIILHFLGVSKLFLLTTSTWWCTKKKEARLRKYQEEEEEKEEGKKEVRRSIESRESDAGSVRFLPLPSFSSGLLYLSFRLSSFYFYFDLSLLAFLVFLVFSPVPSLCYLAPMLFHHCMNRVSIGSSLSLCLDWHTSQSVSWNLVFKIETLCDTCRTCMQIFCDWLFHVGSLLVFYCRGTNHSKVPATCKVWYL